MNLNVFVNHKKMIVYFFLLIFGLALLFYGLMSYAIQMGAFESKVSDAEIIERAKALGMVEIKSILNDKGGQDD